MIALLTAILSQFWPYIAAGFGVLALIFQQRRAGAKSERAKQAKRDRAAVNEQLEMHREATQAERDAAALADDRARQEAAKWSKR